MEHLTSKPTRIVNNFDPVAAHLRDHFGIGLHPDDIAKTDSFMPKERSILPTGYNRPWAIIQHRKPLDEINSTRQHTTTAEDGSFQVCIDVHHFAPKEIHVQTLGNVIIVKGNHEERSDVQGSIERHFMRKYTLPEHFDKENILTTLSTDGVLTVKVSPVGSHCMVPVYHTGPAHLSIKSDHIKFADGTKEE
jgi:crystallin, alpha B